MEKTQAESANLVEWVYWMATDILLSFRWNIEYQYVYWDKREKDIIVLKQLVESKFRKRYERMEACAVLDEEKIFISPDAEDKALCLFHECMEILFSDWKDEYFVPKRWGLKKSEDPILNLEAATWEHFTEDQKAAIKSFLPKEP